MSYQTERDQFIAEGTRAGLSIGQVRRLLRHASTLQRLAVASCNGDWPCDNGDRKVDTCPLCGGGFVPSAIVGGGMAEKAWQANRHGAELIEGSKLRACPDCRTEAAVVAVLAGEFDYRAEGKAPRLIPKFGGDPRGAVLRLYPATAKAEEIENGRERGIYVPARER